MDTFTQTDADSKPLLSAKALALVSEFALMLYRHNGTLISVDSKDVIANVFEHAQNCDNDRINSIFKRLQTELKNHGQTASTNKKAALLKQQLRQLTQ